ncbi:hypothetical protein FOPG_00741 [Fusarium oxysporum f. sp. conglutinans race 2 54008]|uniref:Uncharacterized protein n=3 Tax=Fusarium oxysporum TaxID=5507 RepID=X0NS85_FUSOX|nr:hypothetical protein FOVG_09199 [Fusarium oxysporum f. sp. pisi HDV247]EXL88429.1 hypothetical protein FOPG_00741 [Fusarium oxysporum f. sp. conglutinans race 2 54008]EXM35395.1 hypothetical protein FOTG_01845 [Fusarium oxysporum f. sp. vasinfectum 25433]EXA40311.1 hypothetical protein FOVG_09199 [Fusarium oxysporum f. sp. pisi HDV247]EXL88430.1 hypothetical protein FOPG_00741 [Fusarium oxysporum f. sp. conglutinans race 2 54008]
MLTSSPILIPDLINTPPVGCFNRARFTFIHHAGTRTDRSLKPAMYSAKAKAWQRLSLYSDEAKLTSHLGVMSLLATLACRRSCRSRNRRKFPLYSSDRHNPHGLLGTRS